MSWWHWLHSNGGRIRPIFCVCPSFILLILVASQFLVQMIEYHHLILSRACALNDSGWNLRLVEILMLPFLQHVLTIKDQRFNSFTGITTWPTAMFDLKVFACANIARIGWSWKKMLVWMCLWCHNLPGSDPHTFAARNGIVDHHPVRKWQQTAADWHSSSACWT